MNPLLLLALTLPVNPTAGSPSDSLRFGPYPVGYRLVPTRDLTRATGPRHDFEGAPTGVSAGTPVQISIWYPARREAGGRPMRFGEYRDLGARREDLAPVQPEDRQASIESVLNAARFGFDREISRARAESLLARPMRAVRDVPAADGRFPVVLGGLGPPGSAALLGEYLASHGFVVVSTPSLPETAGLQVTNRPAALEIQTRNLEFLRGFVPSLGMADTARLHVVGVNFDGMAAVNYQMRNMDARVVVSLDGWEAKSLGVPIVRESPWFDVRRLRVPYLAFTMDHDGRDQLRPDVSLLDTLKYAERALYQPRGLGHLHFVDDVVALALSDATVLGTHARVFETVLAWLEGATDIAPAADRLLVADRRAALLPVPTAAEFEELVMAGHPDRLRAVIEHLWRAEPDAALFTEREITLYAFRFRQREEWDMVRTLLALGLRAYPDSEVLRRERADLEARKR